MCERIFCSQEKAPGKAEGLVIGKKGKEAEESTLIRSVEAQRVHVWLKFKSTLKHVKLDDVQSTSNFSFRNLIFVELY
jgi:tRNA(Phe) wybutosine-synthesizing methylase Tyw3